MTSSIEDRIWNRACIRDVGDSSRDGDFALAELVTFHGLVMNGRVQHAIEGLRFTRKSVGGISILRAK